MGKGAQLTIKEMQRCRLHGISILRVSEMRSSVEKLCCTQEWMKEVKQLEHGFGFAWPHTEKTCDGCIAKRPLSGTHRGSARDGDPSTLGGTQECQSWRREDLLGVRQKTLHKKGQMANISGRPRVMLLRNIELLHVGTKRTDDDDNDDGGGGGGGGDDEA